MRHHHLGHPKKTCPGCFDEVQEIIQEKQQEARFRLLAASMILLIISALILVAILGNRG